MQVLLPFPNANLTPLLIRGERKIRTPLSLCIALRSLILIFMEAAEGIELRITAADDRQPNSTNARSSDDNKLQFPKHINYKRWLRVTLYTLFLLSGLSAATLLRRLYYDKGGSNKWMATFVQSAGFPILLPFLFFFNPSTTATTNPISSSFANKPKGPKYSTLAFLYIVVGVILTGHNLMYSYGISYLPVSTYSLLCATQLAFTAVSSFFLNSQKFNSFIFNSLVLVTASASLLAVKADSEKPAGISREKYVIGFVFTLGASATSSLYLSLVQLSFEKVIKKETFSTVLNMQIYPSFVATCGCVVGVFASGEWRNLSNEMKEYEEGKASYLMTLIWTAVTWQISSLGLLGLIFEVSSLFSNVVSTLALPIIPILAVVLFHDKMNAVKVMAMLLAIWGFLSYIYQLYLDDAKSKKSDANRITRTQLEVH